MGNFEFFEGPWTPYRDIAEAAERMVYSDPNAAMSKLRSFGEMMAQELWVRHKFPEVDGISQFERIRELEGNDMIDRQTAFYLHELRVKGNKAAHNAMYGTPDEAISLLSIAYQLSVWFMRTELEHPAFHAPAFKKPLAHDKPVVPHREEATTKKKRVAKKVEKPAAKKSIPSEAEPTRTKKAEPSPLRRKMSDLAKAQEKPQPKSVTTVKRTKKAQQQAKTHEPWHFPVKWMAASMVVVGAITAALSADSERTNQLLGAAPQVAEKPAPSEQKKPALLAGDTAFELNALRLLRGDTSSTQKIRTYTDLAMTKAADKLQVRETYAVYKVRGDAYQLANGQYVSKKKIATTTMQDVPVYQASYSSDIRYGTVYVQLAEPLNVRAAPTTTSDIIGVTYKGHRYEVYGQQGAWYRIGQDAWISANPEYVTFEKGSGQ